MKRIFLLMIIFTFYGCANHQDSEGQGKKITQSASGFPVKVGVQREEGLPVELAIKEDVVLPVELKIEETENLPVKLQIDEQAGLPVQCFPPVAIAEYGCCWQFHDLPGMVPLP